MRPIAWFVLGLTAVSILAAPVAVAAPTGVCGEGGGLWDTADTLCVYEDGICIWYSRATPFLICT